MKVFWLLLFGISTLPFGTADIDDFEWCRSGITEIKAKEYCIIKIYKNGTDCEVEYGTVNKIDVAPKSEWGDAGCEMQMDGIVYCYCNGADACNVDIVDFHNDLEDAANKAKEEPNQKKLLNCIRPAIKRECAVGKPGRMVLEKRRKTHGCVITLKKDQDTYKVVEVGQKLIVSSVSFLGCEKDDDIIICNCIDQRCNIQVDGVRQIDVTRGMNYRQDLAAIASQISSFPSGIRMCGDSVAVYDPNGTKSCALAFKKNESGEYTTEISFVEKDQKATGCFTSETEFDGNVVTCICDDYTCEMKELLAGLTMKLNGDGCVQEATTTLQTTSIPTTSTPTTSTSVASTSALTTTMTTTTTTALEQLTCWASDLSKVTKDKTNSVCFIDYAMINSRCELRGKGIDEEGNATTGCRVVGEATMRCTCLEDGCNKQFDNMWKKAVFNNTENVLIECVDRLVHGDTLPTSGTSSVAPIPTSLSQTEDYKGSSYFGLFIGSVAFNVLLLVTVLALIVALVKMKKKKGGEANQETAKPEKKTQHAPIAITIEKPAVSKELSKVPPPAPPTKSAEQNEASADKTATGTGTQDMDTTGGTSDSDSTGPEAPSEVRWTVSGFNRD